MSNEVEIRPGGAEDHETAMAVWRRSAGSAEQPLSDRYGSRLRGYLVKPDSFLLLAGSGSEVFGMAVGMQAIDIEGDGSVIPGLCHIAAVFVVPEWWGSGIGKLLVDAVLAEAKGRSYERAQLWTHVSNRQARQLYESKGFFESGWRQDEGEDEILHYERPLQPS